MFKPVFLNSVARKAIVPLAMLFLTGIGFAAGSAPGGGGGGGKACSVISKFTVTSGPAQWTDPFDDVTITYILKGCSPGFVPAGTVTATNLDAAGLPPYYYGGPSVMTGNITGLLGKFRFFGYNLTPYNANVRVDLVVVDPATGAVVDSQSITVLTPPKV